MSKVNIDEIKVGDLVAYSRFDDSIRIGYVTGLSETKVTAYWSIPNMVHHSHMPIYRITGHWKVINFEEEAKVDELKVYTGRETIEALLEGKIIQGPTHNKFMYRITDTIQVTHEQATGWADTDLSMDFFLKNKFTEVVTPQVGDWVKVPLSGKTQVGCVTDINEWYVYIDTSTHKTRIELKEDWQILSPEEVSEYKREQAFVNVGRKLNEFKSGDIVMIDCLDTVAIVISKKNEANSIIKLHGINEVGKGYDAGAHQLTPISFVEQQVDLS